MIDYNPPTASSRSWPYSELAPKVRAHVFVSGRVQGVFYREAARNMAQRLDVKGWVRNLPDGRVEAIFEGEENKVEEIIKWAKKGPIIAKVKNVEVLWEEYEEEFYDFKIRYD
jgi:acylphosphatase